MTIALPPSTTVTAKDLHTVCCRARFLTRYLHLMATINPPVPSPPPSLLSIY